MFNLATVHNGGSLGHPSPGRISEWGLPPDTVALHWILRVAVAACFIGHGAFGIITKAAWLPYFAIFGIPEAWAWRLMPMVGIVDITVGVLTLFQPVRAVVLYMAFWGFQTACLRPLAGQGVWELFERAGNYGVPLALLCLLGTGRSLADWFSARPAPALTVARASTIGWILRVTTGLLLIGHGGFDFAMHKDWTGYAAAIGSARPRWRRIHFDRSLGGSSAPSVCSSSPGRRAACCCSSLPGNSAPKPSGRWPASRYGSSSSAAAATARLSPSRGFEVMSRPRVMERSPARDRSWPPCARR